MRCISACALAVAAVGTTAHGAFISFASDSSPTNPTLVGTYSGGGVTHVADFGPTPVQLLVDADENGPGGPVALGANLTVSFNLAYSGSTVIAPGFFTHTFSTVGFFEFRDPGTSALILRGDVASGTAALVALGSSTFVLSASISGFNTSYTLGTVAATVGFGGIRTGDFGFTITSLNNGGGVALVNAAGSGAVEGIAPFSAESSFSGHFIPAPGAVSLLAVAGAFASRRKR